MSRLRSRVGGGIVVVGLAVALAGSVAFRLLPLPESAVESLAEQLRAEQRAITIRSNADRAKAAAMLGEFTGNKPVEVVRLEDGGVIVANERGEEWFMRNGEESPAIGEVRWTTLDEEGIAIGPVAE